MKPILYIESGIQRWRGAKGTYHKLDGPAEIFENGYQVWYFYGRVHRLDGPARIGPHSSFEEWWVDGFYLPDIRGYLKHKSLVSIVNYIRFNRWTLDFHYGEAVIKLALYHGILNDSQAKTLTLSLDFLLACE